MYSSTEVLVRYISLLLIVQVAKKVKKSNKETGINILKRLSLMRGSYKIYSCLCTTERSSVGRSISMME